MWSRWLLGADGLLNPSSKVHSGKSKSPYLGDKNCFLPCNCAGRSDGEAEHVLLWLLDLKTGPCILAQNAGTAGAVHTSSAPGCCAIGTLGLRFAAVCPGYPLGTLFRSLSWLLMHTHPGHLLSLSIQGSPPATCLCIP